MDKINMVTKGTDYLVGSRLYFENGGLYITKIPCVDGEQVDFSEKIDITEEILDIFLKIIDKRRADAYQKCMIEQLKKRY